MSYLAIDAVRTERPDWRWLPLRRLTRLRREPNTDASSPLLALSSERGVEPRPQDGGRQLPSDETVTSYWRVYPNDLVFNPMWAIGGGVAVSAISGAVSPAYRIYSPADLLSPRFLHYVMRSRMAIDQYQLLVRGITTFDRSITREDLDGMPIPVPPLDEQRAIADYLDRETARIDALIATKERMRTLINEKDARAFDDAIAGFGARPPAAIDGQWSLPPAWRTVNLSQVLVQLTNGYVGPTRDILVDDGIRYIQSLHIKGGTIDFERGHYFVTSEWHSERPRIHLRQGDVLIVQTGDIGQVAVVPPGFGEASCHALLIARVNRSLVSGEFLGAYLRSPFGQASLLSRATGALHPHLEGGIKSVPVVVPPPDVQARIVGRVRSQTEQAAMVSAVLARQADLLHERRQALITDAVTGEIEVQVAT